MAKGPKHARSIVGQWEVVFDAILGKLDNGVGDITVSVDQALEKFKEMYNDLTLTSWQLPTKVFEELQGIYKRAGWKDVTMNEGIEKISPNKTITFIRE